MPIDKTDDAFFSAINKNRKDDPLVGAKLGATELVNRLINAFRSINKNGVHIETLLCILGSLAGYSCQASLRKEYIEKKGLNEEQIFTIIEAANGRRFFFGDLINKPLLENPMSVWRIAAGAIQILGAGKIIDIIEIFKYVSSTVGADTFGIPRIPEGHEVSDIPSNYVKCFWNTFLPTIEKYCANESEWPILYGLAVQKAILMGNNVIDPTISLTIAMECAVPMAKAEIRLS